MNDNLVIRDADADSLGNVMIPCVVTGLLYFFTAPLCYVRKLCFLHPVNGSISSDGTSTIKSINVQSCLCFIFKVI